MAAIFFALLLLAGYDAGEKSTADESSGKLAKVRRIYVDILTGGDAALQIRDLLMTSLQRSKLFLVTEDPDKADATLKGAGSDDVFTDSFQSSEGINAHSQLGGGTTSKTNTARYTGVTIGENESHHSTERKHEAMATV